MVNIKCKDIKFGTYDCVYTIQLPWHRLISQESRTWVAVDKCLLPEVLYLWESGIKTTGCCCGHGRDELAYIGVCDEHIQKMKDMGYRVHYNKCRPNDEDSFTPKSILTYDKQR